MPLIDSKITLKITDAQKEELEELDLSVLTNRGEESTEEEEKKEEGAPAGN